MPSVNRYRHEKITNDALYSTILRGSGATFSKKVVSDRFNTFILNYPTLNTIFILKKTYKSKFCIISKKYILIDYVYLCNIYAYYKGKKMCVYAKNVCVNV